MTSRSLLRSLVPVVAGLAVVLAPTPCRTAPKPLTAEEQAKVDRAIAKGIEYLKNTQRKNGSWPATDGPLPRGFHDSVPFGNTLLAALALLESGVPADDPCVQKAAESLRRNLGKMKTTYEISLAVLFLDRLGDPRDKELVRDLSLRLVAFQGYSGGWGYSCPTLSKKNRDDLLRALREQPKEGPRPGTGKKPSAQVPPALKRLAIFKPPDELMRPTEPADKGHVLYVGTTDGCIPVAVGSGGLAAEAATARPRGRGSAQ